MVAVMVAVVIVVYVHLDRHRQQGNYPSDTLVFSASHCGMYAQQELYGAQQPNIPTVVSEALPVATATVLLPTAYAVPEEGAERSVRKKKRVRKKGESKKNVKSTVAGIPLTVNTFVAAALWWSVCQVNADI